MGRQCLYCSIVISEYAIECPKCGAAEPFNASKKRIIEEQTQFETKRELAKIKMQEIEEMTKQELKRLFPYTIICSDCNGNLTVSSFGKVPCPHCGYPYNYIKCYCGKVADGYDPISRNFCCSYHLPEPCSSCFKIVAENYKIKRRMEVGVGGRCSSFSIYGDKLFCPSCHHKQFTSSNRGGCFNSIFIIILIVIISFYFLLAHNA